VNTEWSLKNPVQRCKLWYTPPILYTGKVNGVMNRARILTEVEEPGAVVAEWRRVGLHQPFSRGCPEGLVGAAGTGFKRMLEPVAKRIRCRTCAGRTGSVGTAALFDRRLALRLRRYLDYRATDVVSPRVKAQLLLFFPGRFVKRSRNIIFDE
jgi:hypothetical protein